MFNFNLFQLLSGWLGQLSSTSSAGAAAQALAFPVPSVTTTPAVSVSPVASSWTAFPASSTSTSVLPSASLSPTQNTAASMPVTNGRRFYGTQGRDVLTTGAANDLLDGGMGNDTLDAGAGDNVLRGGMGDDTLIAGHGANQVDGGMGNDVIRLGNGRNTVDGGLGNDRITAGNGGNRIDAGMGDDHVATGSGDDTLTGGMGNDYLSAGAGNDVYQFDGAFGHDVIDNKDGSAATTDKVVFSLESGIDAKQLWFRRDGADLVVEAVRENARQANGVSNNISGLNFGSGVDVFGGVSFQGNAGDPPQREGQITLRNWYADAASQVDVFQDASGRTLQKGQIDSLVSAMAGFGPAPASLASLSDAQRQQLDVVVASNWAG